MTPSSRTSRRPAAPATVYFSVDIEASGPVPGLYNLVSIGAVPVSLAGDAWRPEPEVFYVELKPIAPGFDPDAMRIHGLTRRHLEEHGVGAEEAMRRLSRFVADRVRKRERAVFAGHNAVFDWSYIAYYYALFGAPNPFGYKALEIKSLAMGRLGIGWFETSKENLEVLLPGLPRQDPARVHHADDDAVYQAWILSALLNREPGAPEGWG